MASELKDLGRTVELRRARPRRFIVLLVAVAVVWGAVSARAADDQDASIRDLMVAPELAIDVAPPVDESGQGAQDPVDDSAVQLPVLGRVGDLLVHVPAEDAVLVSYHEAAFPEALAISPLGSLLGNENPTRGLDHAEDAAGVPFHVQVSRGRANAPTSAVDVVMRPGEQVRAPVTGTVTDVRSYRLYGSHEDVRLEIRPDGAPDRAIVLIHVQDVVVGAGDRVVVGDVLAGAARQFPFSAVVDRQTAPDRFGHVHLEVKQLTADPAVTP